ncbi:MAG: Hsp20 family protein [Rhizomicrobium sp.]
MDNESRNWMWSEACEMLARAERLQQQLFEPGARSPQWQPPVDVLETAREVLIFVALPGVNIDRVETTIEGAALVLSGVRQVPPELRTAAIHRLELPQGRFFRRVPIPAGRYLDVRRTAADGCLVVVLEKAEAGRG